MQVNSFAIYLSDIIMLVLAILTSVCQLIGIRAMTVLCQNPGQDGLFMVCWMIQSYVTWYFTYLYAANIILTNDFVQSYLGYQMWHPVNLWSLIICMILLLSSLYYLFELAVYLRQQPLSQRATLDRRVLDSWIHAQQPFSSKLIQEN